MNKYFDRYEAGKILAEKLQEFSNQKNVIVLALPRGGVPVAYEIAKYLSVPMDVFIVRKLGVPGQEEVAMGAISLGDTVIFNEDIIHYLSIPKSAIDKVIHHEKQELERRNLKYRSNKPFPFLTNKIIILVDDGIATGATMRAAVIALKQHNPFKIIVAVPVASYSTCQELSSLVEKIVCPLRPYQLHAVGVWYENFSQTSDDQVIMLLGKT